MTKSLVGSAAVLLATACTGNTPPDAVTPSQLDTTASAQAAANSAAAREGAIPLDQQLERCDLIEQAWTAYFNDNNTALAISLGEAAAEINDETGRVIVTGHDTIDPVILEGENGVCLTLTADNQ